MAKNNKIPFSYVLYSDKKWVFDQSEPRVEDMNFMFSWEEQYHRYCSCHSNIKFIYSRHRVISSIGLNVLSSLNESTARLSSLKKSILRCYLDIIVKYHYRFVSCGMSKENKRNLTSFRARIHLKVFMLKKS